MLPAYRVMAKKIGGRGGGGGRYIYPRCREIVPISRHVGRKLTVNVICWQSRPLIGNILEERENA